MAGGTRNSRFVVFIITASALITFLFISAFRSQPEGTRHPNNVEPTIPDLPDVPDTPFIIDDNTFTGPVIMPKLGNETVKAELGRATWKFLHTTFARFPEKPSAEESSALQAFIHLFARLYPCGECAQHFSKMLEDYPPQVSSRSAAAAWGCHVHNEVNKRLHKDLFDCSKIGDFYDCGCADDEPGAKTKTASVSDLRLPMDHSGAAPPR